MTSDGMTRRTTSVKPRLTRAVTAGLLSVALLVISLRVNQSWQIFVAVCPAAVLYGYSASVGFWHWRQSRSALVNNKTSKVLLIVLLMCNVVTCVGFTLMGAVQFYALDQLRPIGGEQYREELMDRVAGDSLSGPPIIGRGEEEIR